MRLIKRIPELLWEKQFDKQRVIFVLGKFNIIAFDKSALEDAPGESV